MAEQTNLEYWLGETWEIDFSLNDAADADLDLNGALVKFRLSKDGVLVLELTTDGGDIVVESPPSGNGTILVEPSAQTSLFAAVYSYEVRAVLADSRVTTQVFGSLTVRGTLFQ